MKCAMDYAGNNGAESWVSINDRTFEFFFRPTPEGTVELDREMALEIHQDLEMDRYENIQGG